MSNLGSDFGELFKLKVAGYGRPGWEPDFFVSVQFSDSKSCLAWESPVKLSTNADTLNLPQKRFNKKLWIRAGEWALKRKEIQFNEKF